MLVIAISKATNITILLKRHFIIIETEQQTWQNAVKPQLFPQLIILL